MRCAGRMLMHAESVGRPCSLTASEQVLQGSGRRESNSHHQLGRLVQAPFVTMSIARVSWSKAILTDR